MNKPTELLPCPFCGSVGEHMFAPCSTPISYIQCVDCGANGPDFAEEHEGDTEYAAKAIAAWNTRALTTDTTGD
jgi:Lar family restriction alleviation protein